MLELQLPTCRLKVKLVSSCLGNCVATAWCFMLRDTLTLAEKFVIIYAAAVMETESENILCRTVVVSGVPAVLPLTRMVDKLTIHFQSNRRSRGGDVDSVKYPTNLDGVAFVTFSNQKDAERVLMKEQQVMTDSEFPEDYRLTVFPFSRDVFFYVRSATVDLSEFGTKQSSLVESLRSTHRSLRFQAFPRQSKVFIEGPLSGVLALKGDLQLRASRLKSTVKLNETALNPRLISHHNSVSSVSCSGDQEPAGSRSLSLHNTGEPTEVQSLHSNTENISTKQKVFNHHHKKKEVKAEGIKSSGQDFYTAEKGSHVLQNHYTTGENHSSGLKDLTSFQAGPGPVCPQDQEDMWVDLYTFRYVEKCQKKELDRCLRGVDLSVECVEGVNLVRLFLTEKKPGRIQEASENLQILMDFWQSMLRVHEIPYDKAEQQKVTQICEKLSLLFTDILYVFEFSSIKIIGPTVSSFLFHKMVEDDIERQ